MPLSGTIQDFGVADIFQLISQQAKTGRLSLSNGIETAIVLFRDGVVVHAESQSTPKDRLFGSMLVRAEVISKAQLEQALEEQQRTLKRIGSVLIDLGFVDHPTVVEFARLQVTETLYGLFAWTRGTYEFETTEVEASPDGVEPIRAEHVVMNGIRMTDEWPSIREQIPSYAWTVERMRALPRPSENGSDGFDVAFGSPVALGDGLGASERALYALIGSGRSVQKLIDLGRLGEFETCRALSELIGGGYVRVVKPRPPAAPGPTLAQRLRWLALDVGRIALSAGLVILAGGLVARGLAERRAPRELRLADRAVQRRLEAAQRRILERALEIHLIVHGRYPDTLDALVQEGLVEESDLTFPYDERYHYVAEGESFELATPLR